MPDLELTREVLHRAGVTDDHIDPESLEFAAKVLDKINEIVTRRLIECILTGDSNFARKIRRECLGESQN